MDTLIRCRRDLSTAALLREREREWTVQSLIVDRTHLELVSGKLVLQKKVSKPNVTI